MKLFLSFLCLVTLATVRQSAAQGYGRGMGMDSNSSSARPPSTTNYQSMNSTATANSNTSSAGPLKATVSLSDGSRSGASFSAKTRQLTASYTTTGTNKGDKLKAVWVSKVNGQKKINETNVTSEQANFGGAVALAGPASGWPAGKYELDLFVNNKLVAHQPFQMGK